MTMSGKAAGNPAGVLASRTAPLARGAGWVTDGFRGFAADPGAWLGISILMVVLSLLVQGLLPVLGTVIVFLLSPVLVGGLMQAMAERDGGRALRVGDLLRAFSGPHVGALVRIGAVSLLLNVLAFSLMLAFVDYVAVLDVLTKLAQNEDMLRAASDLTYALGLLTGALLYIALLIPITMLVWFAPALVVLEGEGALPAMKHSFVGCARNFMPYLVYGLVGLVLFPLVLVFTFGLGFLVLVPVGLVSIHVAYRDIFHRA